MIDLVIFDFDGTLVESETLAAEIEADMLKGLGLQMTPEEVVRAFSGVTPDEMTRSLQEDYGLSLPADFYEEFEERFFVDAQKRLSPTPNAKSILDTLDLPYCLASNSSQEWIDIGLQASGLAPYFENRSFPASLVDSGKPEPDLFLFVADKFDVTPANCLVIEDSISGVKGATTAGTQCIGYIGGGHCGPEHGETLKRHGATHIIEDHLEIIDLVKSAS